jgi:hypothetical protein
MGETEQGLRVSSLSLRCGETPPKGGVIQQKLNQQQKVKGDK